MFFVYIFFVSIIVCLYVRFCFGICNTQWEVLLSKQVNYNQVVVKYQILQECFLQNFNTQKFQNMEQIQGLSRAWNFFPQIQGLLKDPMNPAIKNLVRFSSVFGQQDCTKNLRV